MTRQQRASRSHPMFSVIVNAYNVREYIDGALASIAAQTFDDYEVVLVDDGSTDGTLEVLRSFALSHDSIRVLARGHQGLLLARRAGLADARGDYIMFLDGDDCLHRDTLRRCAEEIASTRADIIMFRYSREPGFTACCGHDTPVPGHYTGDAYFRDIRPRLCRGEFWSIWGKAYRRSCIDVDADYSPYAGLNHAEDLFQMLPIFDRASSLSCIDDILYFHRKNPRSLTAGFREDMLVDCGHVVGRLRTYGKRWGAESAIQENAGERTLYRKMLMLADALPRLDRRHAFREIRAAMVENGSLKRALEGSRTSRQRLLFWLVEHDCLTMLHACIVLKRTSNACAARRAQGVGRRSHHARAR